MKLHCHKCKQEIRPMDYKVIILREPADCDLDIPLDLCINCFNEIWNFIDFNKKAL